MKSIVDQQTQLWLCKEYSRPTDTAVGGLYIELDKNVERKWLCELGYM